MAGVASTGFVFCLAVLVADFVAVVFVCVFGSADLGALGERVAVFAGVLGLAGDEGAADTVGF